MNQNNKGFINIIVAIIIVFVVFILGYSILNKKSEAPVINQNQSSTTEANIPKGGPTQDGKCGDGVCGYGENTPSYPYYCPKDCGGIINPAETNNWQTYQNSKLGFEVKYPNNIFKLDSNNNTLSHTLQNFHKSSAKDGSDLGLAKDIALTFYKKSDHGCDWLENELNIKSLGVPFDFKLIKGIRYETGAEGEGIIYYCVKDNQNKNIFEIQRVFLNESYSTDLPKQKDFIPSAEQESVTNQILQTFKFTN